MIIKALRVLCGALVFLVMGVAVVPAVHAEDYGRSFELISELNRVNPEQNPRYEDSEDVLGRRVIDRKRKVIGDVKDIILNENGTIEQLNVQFNRLRLNTSIFLSYQSMGIEPSTNGYAMNFDSGQIEQLYPTLLAGTETAAGDDEIFSVRSVIGGAVKSQKGKVIGRVEDVLFGAEGARAEALLVKLTQGTLRGEKVAVPFTNPRFEQVGAKKNVILSNDMAQAVVDFAKTQ